MVQAMVEKPTQLIHVIWLCWESRFPWNSWGCAWIMNGKVGARRLQLKLEAEVKDALSSNER
jgi:hypothetical protein